MTYARDERLALCALLDKTGPGSPDPVRRAGPPGTWPRTWWSGNTGPTPGLACSAGRWPGTPAGCSARSRSGRRIPRLVEEIRNGPPRVSVFGLPGADERLNLVEYFVHHEDVRRGEPGLGAARTSDRRPVRPAVDAAPAWPSSMLRKAPVGVEFARDDLPDPGTRGRRRAAGPDHGQGADPGGDRDRNARRADHVDVGPDDRGRGSGWTAATRMSPRSRRPLAGLTRVAPRRRRAARILAPEPCGQSAALPAFRTLTQLAVTAVFRICYSDD